MAGLFDLAKMTVSGAPGTGSTINLGAAAVVSGVLFLSFSDAGVTNGQVVDYSILDAGNGGGSEIGTATYLSAGPQLAGRTPTFSTNGNAAINASAGAVVSISPRAETLNNASLFTAGLVGTARLGSGSAGPTTALFGDQTYKPIPGSLVGAPEFHNSSATITIPANATKMEAVLLGGTGAGRANSGGGGGGAGQLKTFTGLTPGLTVVFTAGAAGASPGGNGGTSTLVSGTQSIATLTSLGGNGAPSSVGSGGPTSALGGAGGAAPSSGDVNCAGQTGSMGSYNYTPTCGIAASITVGVGGVSGFQNLSQGANGGANAGQTGVLLIRWYTS